MLLTDQVTSLQLSKKLKELGVKQESYFYWWETRLGKDEILSPELKHYGNKGGGTPYYSAFTVAELAKIINDWNNAIRLDFIGTGVSWSIAPKANIPHFKAGTMTDCLAEMLIYLLENNLIPATSLTTNTGSP